MANSADPDARGIPPRRSRVAMVQDGARLHYAVPLALQWSGILERVFTDWYSAPGTFQALLSGLMANVGMDLGRRMQDRYCSGLDPRHVTSSACLTMKLAMSRRCFEVVDAYYEWSSRAVGTWILRKGLGQANSLMGFVRNIHPDVVTACRERGMVTVADQIIAPAMIEMAEARRQTERWPSWSSGSEMPGLERLVETEHRTWAALDHMTCASEYVRDGLVGQGVDRGKITVLPYPVDTGVGAAVGRGDRSGPVLVGFVGAVGLRKGAPYFLEVAQRVASPQVRFVMVGPVGLSEQAVAELRRYVEVVGSVPRSDVAGWLEKFDILLFPSTCEGSAGAVMEAMASGLPVVTTPNSGTVIRHEIEGYVAGYEEIDRLCGFVRQLSESPDLRLRMGQAARRRVEELNIGWYSRQLADLFERHCR